MADEDPSEPGFWEKAITGLKTAYHIMPEVIAVEAEVLAGAYELLPEAAGAGAEQIVEGLVSPIVKTTSTVADLAIGGNGKEEPQTTNGEEPPTTNGEEKTNNSAPTTTWFNTWGLFVIALIGVIVLAFVLV